MRMVSVCIYIHTIYMSCKGGFFCIYGFGFSMLGVFLLGYHQKKRGIGWVKGCFILLSIGV